MTARQLRQQHRELLIAPSGATYLLPHGYTDAYTMVWLLRREVGGGRITTLAKVTNLLDQKIQRTSSET